MLNRVFAFLLLCTLAPVPSLATNDAYVARHHIVPAVNSAAQTLSKIHIGRNEHCTPEERLDELSRQLRAGGTLASRINMLRPVTARRHGFWMLVRELHRRMEVFTDNCVPGLPPSRFTPHVFADQIRFLLREVENRAETIIAKGEEE